MFVDSREHAGLQLIDIVPHVIREAIVSRTTGLSNAAYGLIRENLRTDRSGQALRLVRYTTGQDSIDEERYRPLL